MKKSLVIITLLLCICCYPPTLSNGEVSINSNATTLNNLRIQNTLLKQKLTQEIIDFRHSLKTKY